MTPESFAQLRDTYTLGHRSEGPLHAAGAPPTKAVEDLKAEDIPSAMRGCETRGERIALMEAAAALWPLMAQGFCLGDAAGLVQGASDAE